MHNGSTVQGKLKTIVSSFRLIFEYWININFWQRIYMAPTQEKEV